MVIFMFRSMMSIARNRAYYICMKWENFNLFKYAMKWENSEAHWSFNSNWPINFMFKVLSKKN